MDNAKLLAFISDAFLASPQLASSERHDAFNELKALLQSPRTAELHGAEYLRGVEHCIYVAEQQKWRGTAVQLYAAIEAMHQLKNAAPQRQGMDTSAPAPSSLAPDKERSEAGTASAVAAPDVVVAGTQIPTARDTIDVALARAEKAERELAEERDRNARYITEQANELLRAMGGDPGFSLIENAKRLRARSEARVASGHDAYDLIGPWNALTLHLGEELSEQNRAWRYVHAFADALAKHHEAGRSIPVVVEHGALVDAAREALRRYIWQAQNPTAPIAAIASLDAAMVKLRDAFVAAGEPDYADHEDDPSSAGG